MFALLLETLNDQVIRGELDNLGNILSLETRNATKNTNESKGFVSRGSPGLPLVAVLGTVFAFLFIVLLLCFSHKHHKSKKAVQDDQRQNSAKQMDRPSPESQGNTSKLPCYMQPSTKDDASVVEDSAEVISCLPNCCYLSETTTYSY
jgi:hypothetical protein